MRTWMIYLLVCAFLAVSSGSEVLARNWTDKNGKSMEAEFVGAGEKEGTIVLQKADGKKTTVSVKSLSEADQKHIASLKKKEDPAVDTLLDKEPGYEGLTIVIADGYGETIAEAKKDALQSAVSEVVGSLVDAESRVENDELIENILTASNAYVGKHRVLSTKKVDGIYQVQIKAGVARKSLTMRLSADATTQEIDGTSLAGMVETSVKSENDMVLMFAKILKNENFPFSLLDVKVSAPKVVKRGETNTLEFDYTCQANAKKYADFLKKITPVLEKASERNRSFMVDATKAARDDVKEKYGQALKYDPDKLPGREEGKHYFCVNTNIYNSGQSTKWQVYVIPEKFRLPIDTYNRLVPVAELSFYDKQKKLVTVKRVVGGYNGYYKDYFFGANMCSLLAGCSDYTVVPSLSDSEAQNGSRFGDIDSRAEQYRPRYVFALSPFFIHEERYDSYFIPVAQRKIQVTLTKEELEQLDHVEVKLLEDCPDLDKFHETLPDKLKKMDK